MHWAPNFIFQGKISKFNDKYGEGVMLLNNGTIILGQWKKDLLNGIATIFTPFGGLIVANYINGKLNGWSISLFNNKIIIITHHFEDKIDGQRIVFDEG